SASKAKRRPVRVAAVARSDGRITGSAIISNQLAVQPRVLVRHSPDREPLDGSSPATSPKLLPAAWLADQRRERVGVCVHVIARLDQRACQAVEQLEVAWQRRRDDRQLHCKRL